MIISGKDKRRIIFEKDYRKYYVNNPLIEIIEMYVF